MTTDIQPKPALVLLSILLLLLCATAGQADDRRLFQATRAEPYVFVLLDSSGSMHEDVAGGTQALGSGDAPSSKLYVAKSALYDVIGTLGDDALFGWAHLNQESLEIGFKHWLYTRPAAGEAGAVADPPWYGFLPFPAAGEPLWFGPNVEGSTVLSTTELGTCDVPLSDAVSTLTDTLDELVFQLEAFPKLGTDGETTSAVYLQIPGRPTTLAVQFDIVSGTTLGEASIDVEVRVVEVNSDCSVVGAGFDETTTFTLIPYDALDAMGNPFANSAGQLPSDFLNWQQTNVDATGESRLVSQVDFTQPRSIVAQRSGARPAGDDPSNSCVGTAAWDPNDNTATGFGTDTPVTYPTREDPVTDRCGVSATVFERGDVIPWDWIDHPIATPAAVGFELGSREEILARLAPNTVVTDPIDEFLTDLAGEPIPDFRVARYFEDFPDVDGNLQLRPQFADHPPIVGLGNTALEGILDDLREWHETWEDCAENPTGGDALLGCRERFAILVTDGRESCTGDPAAAARRLFEDGVRVFVVAVGTNVDLPVLQEMANQGGTGTLDLDPNDGRTRDCEAYGTCGTNGGVLTVSPTDRADLVDALGTILSSVRGEPGSIAAPATPQTQSTSQNSAFLTEFIPVSGTDLNGLKLNTYAGRLFHYIRPIPLRPTGDGRLVPDDRELCSATQTVECLAWEADRAMRGVGGAQRQTPSSTTTTNLAIGSGIGERRVYYPSAAASATKVGLQTDFLQPMADDNPLLSNLYQTMFSTTVVPATASDELLEVLEATYLEKSAPHPLVPTDTVDFILGDVFHGDPVVFSRPNRSEYLAANLPVGSSLNCRNASGDFDFSQRGYRCFVIKHTYRRQVLLAPANDGMVHAFDAGRFVLTDEEIDNGTGQELFAFVPRLMLPRLKEMRDAATHTFGVDGPPVVDDVFIDPDHTGTPTASDRQWRTVGIGGMREGGKGYYALDLTQPDPYIQTDLTTRKKVVVPNATNYVPSCMRGVAYNATDCGPVPYGAALWEYDGSDDPDGRPNDLGYTWSKVNTGRIRVRGGGNTVVEKYVAIFGGGLVPGQVTGTQANPAPGSHLYIVDIETGKAIYKRYVGDPVPSEPAAVDRNGDTVIDTIYVGTYGGNVYKVDLSTPAGLTSGRINSNEWNPVQIFTSDDDTTTDVVEKPPIFYPPSVLFVASKGAFALAFGTGDREDPWAPSRTTEEGRFFVILDNGLGQAGSLVTLPLRERNLVGIAADSSDINTQPLFDPGPNRQPGWALQLEPRESVVSAAFALSGILLFNTFIPVDGNAGGACEFTGFTNVYSVLAESGNSLGSLAANLPGGGSSSLASRERFRTESGLGSQVFSEFSANPTQDPNAEGLNDAALARAELRQALMGLFPSNCRFGNASVSMRVQLNDGSVDDDGAVDVPVCVQLKNWREVD